MDDLISDFISPEGRKQLEETIAQLDQILVEIKQINSVGIKLTQDTRTAKSLADLEIRSAKLAQNMAILEEKNNKAEISSVKLAEAQLKYAQAAAKSQKVTEESIDAYTQLSQQYKEAARAAQNAGIAFGTNSKQFRDASMAAKEHAERLRELQAAMERNIGTVNRTSTGWNGLRNSVNQMTRELPSLSMGFNQFFLAISN